MDVARGAIKLYDHVGRLQRNTNSVEKCRVPVVCALQGYVIGAGVDIACCCDIRVCAKDTKFTIKEVEIGICADLGSMQRFQKIVGNDSFFREMAYTGRFFTGEEA